VAEHLVVEFVAEWSEIGGEGFSVGVFGGEIFSDLGRVLVSEPGVVVGECDAVDGGLTVIFASDGSVGERAVCHGFFSVEDGEARAGREKGGLRIRKKELGIAGEAGWRD